MDSHSLSAELASHEDDPSLGEEINLAARARALDFAMLLDEVARIRRRDPATRDLKRRADRLRARLEPIDRRLFTRVRAEVQSGRLRGAALRAELDRFTSYRAGAGPEIHLGFDGLDLLLDGVLEARERPDASDVLPPEMVHYEPTPARVILDLIDQVGPGPEDVFYDLGSGDGRVAILVNLLTGATTNGVEIQAGLAARARQVAGNLRLDRVSFVEADACAVDYGDGTVFYLFTPFRGAVLGAALDRMRETTRGRTIAICTYGTCTHGVAAIPWLQPRDPATLHDFRLAVFTRAGVK